MSKHTVTEEFLSNLGLDELKTSEKELALSGEGSSFYAADCETDEGKKLFDLDNLRYVGEDNIKLQNESCKSDVSEKSIESKKMAESA